MLSGVITIKGNTFAVIVDPKFSEWRMYMKPTTLQATYLAEDINPDEYPKLVDTFEEDWRFCRYRLDMDSSLKIKTTLLNKSLAAEISVGMSAANNLVIAQHALNSNGEYTQTWVESFQANNLAGKITYHDGLLNNCYIKTPNMTIELIDFDADGVPEGYENLLVNVNTPQTTILRNEAEKSPKFIALSKCASQLYTLTAHNADYDETLKAKMPKRSGYMSVNMSSSDSGYYGVEYIKTKVAKSSVNMGVYQTIEDVREAHPDKVTDWIEKCQYHIVTDLTLDSVMATLWKYDILSFDTETTGLKINFYSRNGAADELVGLCISGEPGTGYYFPLQHKLFANLCNGDHRYFMQTYMKELLETKPLICHNLNYDWKVAYIYDININCVFDTIHAFGVTKRYEYIDFPLSLKVLCKKLFGFDMFEIEDFVIAEWKNTNVTFADLPYDLVKHYGPADADITFRLWRWCIDNKLLETYGAQRVFDLEVNFAKVVAYSEFWGYHIDVGQLPALEAEIHEGMEREEKELFRIAGREFNPNSSVQLTKIIYQELYPEILKSKTVAKASTSKDILHELESYTTPDGQYVYPFVHHVLEYRRYETTYKNFLKKKAQYITPDGFVFPGIQQLGTNTGRISVKDPNYQSYNDVVKKRVTGRPGFYIFDCDFAQIEYRVLASMAGQDALIKAFDDPDLDYHTHQAARMFSLPYASVTKELRQQSKGINFGLPYGMGDESLGKRVFGARTPENTRKAANLRKRFFEGQDKIQEFFDRVRNQGVQLGYTETWLGRRRYYHRSVFSENAIRRQAGNHVIQGTAADIWKRAVSNFFNRVVKEGLLGKILFCGFIHDELMGEVSVDIDPYVFIKMWREEYELVIDKFCRLYAGFGWGSSWYEAKKADYPPQFIDTLVAKADDSNREPWNGDYKTLIKKTKADLYDFETWRVKDWLEHVEKGTIILPHISGFLCSKVSDWWDELLPKCDFLQTKDVKRDKKGNLKLAPDDDIIHAFCVHEGIEFKPNWVLPPDAVVQKAEPQGTAEDAAPDAEDANAQAEREHAQLICNQTYQMGFFLDAAFNRMYLKHISDAQIQYFISHFCVPSEQADLALVTVKYAADGSAQAIGWNYGIKLENFNAVQEFVRTNILQR